MVYSPLEQVPMVGNAVCRFKGRVVWEVASDSSTDPTIVFSDVVDG